MSNVICHLKSNFYSKPNKAYFFVATRDLVMISQCNGISLSKGFTFHLFVILGLLYIF